MNKHDASHSPKHPHDSAVATVDKAVDKALDQHGTVSDTVKHVADDLAGREGGIIGREAGTLIGTTIAGPPGGLVGGKVGEFVGTKVGEELADLGVDIASKGLSETGDKIVEDFKTAFDKEDRKISRANRKLMRHFKKHTEQGDIKAEYVEKMQDARELRDLCNSIGVDPEEVHKTYIESAKKAQKEAREQILEVYRSTKTAAKQKAHGEKHAESEKPHEEPEVAMRH